MKRLIFTLSIVNAVLNLIVIGLFMPENIITLYDLSGSALLHGSKWFCAVYAAFPTAISGLFLLFFRKEKPAAQNGEDDFDDESWSVIDEFLSGKSPKSDSIDILFTWIFAVINWVMTGFAINSINYIGVILPSITVVMISAFVIFTTLLYSSGESCRICGINVRWLESSPAAKKRTSQLAMVLGTISGVVGICLAACSLFINNNLTNTLAVAQLMIIAYIIPLVYSKAASKKKENTEN